VEPADDHVVIVADVVIFPASVGGPPGVFPALSAFYPVSSAAPAPADDDDDALRPAARAGRSPSALRRLAPYWPGAETSQKAQAVHRQGDEA
jgi:hypothetical protein